MCEICAAVGYDIHNDGFQVNSTTTGNQTGPNIVRLADGRFIVLYQSSDTAGNGIDIRARIFDRDGTATGNDFVVSQTTAGDQTAPGFPPTASVRYRFCGRRRIRRWRATPSWWSDPSTWWDPPRRRTPGQRNRRRWLLQPGAALERHDFHNLCE